MQTGDIIDSRYRLIEPLQTAWLAVNQTGGQHCLIRLAGDLVDPTVAEWLGQVWRTGLPRLLEKFTTADGQVCFIFEYLEGQSLSSLAAAAGKLPAEQLLPLMGQTARILAYLHLHGERPILHLDIKPDHLLLDEQEQINLIDFGAARFWQPLQDESEKLPLPRIAMTPDYAAPELLAGRPCPGSDLFALGLSFLQLLTGQPPAVCRSRPLPELIPGLSSGLQRLIGRCLQGDPDIRYANAEELACDLERLADQNIAIPQDVLQPDPAGPMAENCERPLSGQPPAPLLCVWDGAEFGCELAAVLASNRQVLVIDADLLNPRADLLLGLDKKTGKVGSSRISGGLDLVLSEEQRGHLDIAILNRLVQPTRITGVYALTAQAGLEHYEYYQLDSLNQVIHLSRLISDLVIVLCSRFVFDAFTCLCLQAASRVLVPLAGDSGSFREYRRSIDYLAARQQLDRTKLCFAAFPYNPRTDLSWGTLDELCDGKLVGCITEREKRRKMKSGALPYAANLDRSNLQEYRALIRRLRLPVQQQKEGGLCHS